MQICDILIFAHYIVTQNDTRDILEDAAIAITKERIMALGPAHEMQKTWQAKEVKNLKNALLMPGLINTHGHAPMTFLRGLADDLPLMQWLTEEIFPMEQLLTRRIVEMGASLAFAEMLSTGTTASIDMYFAEDAIFTAAQKTGIRCQGGEGIILFPTLSAPNPYAALKRVEEQAAQYAQNPLIDVCISPHSLYTTDKELIYKCCDLGEKLALPIHIHMAETHTESAECLEKWHKRPIALCQEMGLLRKGTSLVHMVDITEEEVESIAATEVCIVHNPSSNMKLASGVSPVPAMLAQGICVGLGTDGAASNNRQNMFTEMSRAALLQKVHHKDATLMPAQTVLDMATRNGAYLYAGLNTQCTEDILGTLAPGRKADITALNLSLPNMQPMYNPISHLVYAATGMEVQLTMVNGSIVYENGQFCTFSYTDLLEEIHDIRKFVCAHKANK